MNLDRSISTILLTDCTEDKDGRLYHFYLLALQCSLKVAMQYVEHIIQMDLYIHHNNTLTYWRISQ